jgi:hypothetical protein
LHLFYYPTRFIDIGSNTMDDSMPPATPVMEALQLPVGIGSSSKAVRFATPIVKLEDERVINVREALVPYSSSPPPLIDDDSGLLDEGNNHLKQTTDLQSLHSKYSTQLHAIVGNTSLGELQLSTYEYAALEERYRTLSGQHNELRRVASTYNDVIYGTSAYEDPAASIEQLRAEAGREGLRAKALEVDALRPLVRDAGGLQALTIQVESMRALIKQAGGLNGLKEMVMDAHMLRLRVADVGGLQGLDDLVSQVNLLRFEQREFNELKAKIDGPNGLRAKASKYDILQQAFTTVERAPTNNHTQVGCFNAGFNSLQTARPIVVAHRSSPSFGASAGMHPARALLLSATPYDRDPDRDLCEPQSLGNNTKAQNTGLDHMLLGSPRAVKRKHEDEPKASVAKRPRVDVGRASALVQATLGSSSSTVAPRSNTDQLRVPMMRSTSGSYNERSHHEAQGSGMRDETVRHQIQSKTIETRSKTAEKMGTTLINTRNDRLSVDSLLGPSDDDRPTVIKTEFRGDQRHAAHPIGFAPSNINNANNQFKAIAMVGDYPIALWVGPGSRAPCDFNSNEFKTDNQIPLGLASSLAAEMVKYIQNANVQLWNAMPPNRGTCILRYLVDGHRPSGQPRESRACMNCSSLWVKQHRPCALLLDVGGVRMVIFMPLRDDLRTGVRWKEKNYWIMGSEEGEER